MNRPLWLLALLAGKALAAEHPVLLPAVQKIEYHTGSVSVCRLRLQTTSSLNDEDRFTVAQLDSWLTNVCGETSHSDVTLPLSLLRSGLASAVPGANDQAGPESREAYSISITPRNVQLRSHSSTGLFYALQTLRQLVEGSGPQAALPAVDITDYPSFAYRGFMMDFAHGAVLTEDEVKRQIDFLARWKANQYYFYAETTIELNGYPLLRSAASWPQDSIRRIIAYARERHVDVVPCVELYGHLHDLFGLEHYSSFAGVVHGGEINPRNPEALAITEDWLRQLAALFPSPWFHIGMDEPWELERSDPTIAKPEGFYLDQLRRLSGLAVELGKRPMFWADVAEGAFIFKKYPELYGQLPHEVIAVPWFYDSLPDFTPLVKPFADNHVAQMVAPGIANWEEVSTNFAQTFTNIDDFAAAGRQYRVLGIINTAWSDSAQALYREALPAIAYGAVAAWQPSPIDRDHFFANYARVEYPLAATDAAQALVLIGKAQNLLSKAIGKESMFRMWDDPLTLAALARTEAQAAELHECRLALEDARLHLDSVQSAYPNSSTLRAFSLAVRMINFAALRYVYAREIADSFNRMPAKPTSDEVDFYVGRQAGSRNHSRVSDLLDESAELSAEYETEWRAEYRPFRLQTALSRWRAEAEYWRSLQVRMWQSIREFERTGARPSLDQIRASR